MLKQYTNVVISNRRRDLREDPENLQGWPLHVSMEVPPSLLVIAEASDTLLARAIHLRF